MTAINSNRAIRGPVTAVPVVAGKGVRLREDVENNRVVAEVDETVLWSGTVGSTGSTKDLSEDTRNFEKIRVYTQVSTGTTERCVQIFDLALKFSSTQALAFVHVDNISGGNLLSEIIYLCFQANANTFSLLAGCKWSNGTFSQNVSNYDFNIVKVSGINRVASA